jgi:hypothetical protein
VAERFHLQADRLQPQQQKRRFVGPVVSPGIGVDIGNHALPAEPRGCVVDRLDKRGISTGGLGHQDAGLRVGRNVDERATNQLINLPALSVLAAQELHRHTDQMAPINQLPNVLSRRR